MRSIKYIFIFFFISQLTLFAQNLLQLNEKEKAFLAKHPTILVGALDKYAPYSYSTTDGKPQGVSVDFIKKVAQIAGFKIKFDKERNWSKLFKKAQEKQIDVLISATPKKEREQWFLFSKPYISISKFILTRKDDNSIKKLSDIKGKKVALKLGYITTKELLEEFPTIQPYYINNSEEALKAVSSGVADATVSALGVADYIMKKELINNIKFATSYRGEKADEAFAIRNDWPELQTIFNKALNQLGEKEKLKILQYWITPEFITIQNQDLINNLTSAEKDWLKTHKPIQYVYDVDWPPFEWKNELGEHTGIIFDILHLIKQKSGIKFQRLNTEKWSNAIELMETNKADMYSGIGENQQRKQYLHFTKNNIFKTPYVFVTRVNDSHDYLEGFKVINNKKVAVVQGYTIHSILKQKLPKLPLLTVNNVKEGFDKVSNKKLDIFIVNAATAKYFINRKGYDKLKIATKTEFNLELKVALQKQMPPEALSIIDKTLHSISEKEVSDIYFKWTEILVEPQTNWSLIYKIVGGVLIVISIIIYWNRRLKKAVNEKTSELQKLLNSFDENVIASKSDLEGNITYASDALSKISQYSKEELIGKPHSILRHPDMSQEFFKELWETIKTGKVWKGEIKNNKKNGDYYWVNMVITPEFNSVNKIIGYSAIRQDITDQKKVEELSVSLEKKVIERTKELDDERTYIKAIMNSQTNIVISSDGKCLKTANQAFLKFFNVRNIDEFFNLYGDCICDTFDAEHSTVFIQKVMGKEKWLDYVYNRPNQTHKVKITLKDVEHIFTITADKFTFDNTELKTAVFNDITDIERITKEMETIHKKTKASIEYAAIIQHSIVPENNIFNKYFEDFLVIWQPKDIVGGDIYLFEELRDDNECMIMVIDCTGHGVPGAFVTMLVKAIERQIAAHIATDPNQEVSPAWVLEYFNKTMKKLLRQESTESISNAGFDGAIIYYNKTKKIIKFAGAEIELFYIDNGVLKTIKGDRHSIGYKKSDTNYKFTDHLIAVDDGMQFYLTTDGYTDQNGGKKGFPFGKKRFTKILEENYKESMADQQEILLDTLLEYQNNEERNDDMTVVGIKIGRK